MTNDTARSIVLYHYNASPYARKIVMYLALRGLPYSEVKQPVIMPRPDLQAIGVEYRRIPIMAIGKDVYCDTRIIIQKLEELFPDDKLGSTTPEGRALQKLFEIWHTEGPLFFKGVRSMPTKNFTDPAFRKDREQMTGSSWTAEDLERAKPEAHIYMRNLYNMLENLLADDRTWVLETNRPGLIDIEASWLLMWLRGAKALPESLFSRAIFPKTFAWIERFDAVLQSARMQSPKPKKLEGATAAKQILSSNFAEGEGGAPSTDPQKLRKGDQVEVYPTDSGFNNKDHGRLVSLTDQEIVIGLNNGLRLHTPRSGFRVRQVDSKL